jgi:hypothetical protein
MDKPECTLPAGGVQRAETDDGLSLHHNSMVFEYNPAYHVLMDSLVVGVGEKSHRK